MNYRFAERKSATVITLTEMLCPDADIPAGATFVLYRDTYLLPEDYISQDQALYEMNFGGMSVVSDGKEWGISCPGSRPEDRPDGTITSP